MTKKQGQVGRKHKAGTGNCKELQAARRLPSVATSTHRSHEYPNHALGRLRSLDRASKSLQPLVRAHGPRRVPLAAAAT